MVEDNFSPKQVAAALRVSESSVKRWCDRGVIQSIKTFGGHRRIPLDCLMSFLECSNRQLTQPSAIGFPSGPVSSEITSETPEANGEETDNDRLKIFEEALIRGDERECRRILIAWYSKRQSFASVADELIATAFCRLGDMWHKGKIEVFQERRGCEISTRLIHEFRRLIAEPPVGSPNAIGGTSSGDFYSLPGQLIEVVLREAGWRAVNLGTNLPLETLAAAARREHPKLVWISVSHLVDETKFVAEYENFWSVIPRDITIVVGGQGMTDSVRKRMKFTAHCDTLQQFSSLATALR